jgi:predicted dehydrogenase
MADALRWGILGTGGIAHSQTKDLLDNGFTVTAVGSRNQESAESFAAEFGIGTAHGSYEALAADPEVDVIYVSTPHPFHAANALLALDAGKHVLVEKSFTVTAADARAVVDRAAEKGLVVLEAMWTRWLPHMVRIREIIAAGTIGEVRLVIADHNQKLPTDPAHRINNPELAGGALLDLGIYPVSFAFDVLGTPSSVQATGSLSETGVDRSTAIIFGYESGAQALVQCALDIAGPNRAVIVGTEGRIELDTTWYVPTTFTVFDTESRQLEHFDQPVQSRGMQFQAWELERLAAEGSIAGEILPPEQSVTIMETLDEVRRQIGLRYPGE